MLILPACRDGTQFRDGLQDFHSASMSSRVRAPPSYNAEFILSLFACCIFRKS
jgi:hypothetical protein